MSKDQGTSRRSFIARTTGLALGLGLSPVVLSASTSWGRLEQRIHGRLLLPSSPEYDAARKVWNAAIDRHPAAVLLCGNVADVVEGVRFAAAEGLKVSVRCGGHNVAGRAVQDDALLLDLAALNGMSVDTRAMQVEAGGGALLRDMDRATTRFGLATTSGMVADTGIGGLTLGGGIGWLMRRYGLTIDNLVAASVVLANGRQVEASTTKNPDLFWALRGGGGHVGVVTRFTYRLHPVSTILGSQVVYRADQAEKVLRVYRDLCASAPDELTTVAAAMVIKPDAPAVPLRGQPVIGVMACWCGDVEAGTRVLSPLRTALRPEVDILKAAPYATMQRTGDEAGKRGLHTWWESRNIPALDDATISWFTAQVQALTTPNTEIHCHQLGGAVSRGDAQDAAAGLRRNAFVINSIGSSEKPADLDSLAEWSKRATQGFGTAQARTYVNFSSANSAFTSRSFDDGVRARLEAIKRQYDPSSLFT
jgi:hypothetical protein